MAAASTNYCQLHLPPTVFYKRAPSQPHNASCRVKENQFHERFRIAAHTSRDFPWHKIEKEVDTAKKFSFQSILFTQYIIKHKIHSQKPSFIGMKILDHFWSY